MTTHQIASLEIIFALTGPDRPGIVHAVSGFLAERGGDIIDSQQFGDDDSGLFFMRVHARLPTNGNPLEDLRGEFTPVADSLNLTWTITDAEARPRIAILVSKFGHCLNDLLFRWRSGQLGIEIPVIVSNHEDFRGLAEWHGIEFVHIPVTPDTKRDAENELLRVLNEREIDLVVLARYMQVLSDESCRELAGRAINIHHSFLPSFKGGKPYHQAHERGVKLVGATAHYVTAALDEGPIIEQEVARVDHGLSAADLVVSGRDAECIALARAVQWHSENRVFLNGHRTVVFR